LRFSKRTWLISGILYTIYIAYGTLLPFDFSFSPEMIREGLGNIEWIGQYGRHFYSSKNVDVIANFIFFIPLGLIIYNIRYAMGNIRKPFLSILIATVLGLLLSTSIELLQLLIEARRTSYIDMISNSLGCFTGALISAALPRVLTSANFFRLRLLLGKIPLFILLVPVLLSGLLLTDHLSYYFSKSEKIGKAIFNWQYTFQPLGIWRLLFFYIPAGLLGARLCRSMCRIESSKLFYPVSFVVAAIIIMLVELIKSNFFAENITTADIWTGMAGILMGLIVSVIIGNRFYGRVIVKKGLYFGILTTLLLFFSLLIVLKFAYPFQLNFDKPVLADKSIFFLLSTYSFIPFTSMLKLFIYSLQHIILYIPVGILIMEFDTGQSSRRIDFILIFSSVLLIIIPVIIQFFNPYQIPFMYQIPTNTLGLFIGYSMWDGLSSADRQREQKRYSQD